MTSSCSCSLTYKACLTLKGLSPGLILSMRRSNQTVVKLATRPRLRAIAFASSSRSLTSSQPNALPRLPPVSFKPAQERLPTEAANPPAPSTPSSGRRKPAAVKPVKASSPTYSPVRYTNPPPRKIPPPKPRDPHLSTPEELYTLRSHLLVSLSDKVQLGDEEPVIAAVCAYEGGDVACFEIVKKAVAQIEGDIVEIDLTASLALGEHGPLGKVAGCVKLPENPLLAANAESSTTSFDHWTEQDAAEAEAEEDEGEEMTLPNGAKVVRVNLPLGQLLGGSGGGGGGLPGLEPLMFTTSSDRPIPGMVDPKIRDFFLGLINTGTDSKKPRIIYLHDVAGMHATFDAWWPSFVAAVQTRRRGSVDDEGEPTLKRPTTIVLGVAPSLLHVGNHTGGLPTVLPTFGAKHALEEALGLQENEEDLDVQVEVSTNKRPPRPQNDQAKMWMSSPETDESGRIKRNSKRLRAMDNGVIDLPHVLPPIGPKLSGIPPSAPAPPPNPLLNMLPGLFGGGSASRPLDAVSTKFPWRIVPVFPDNDQDRFAMDRYDRRQLLNALQIGRAMSELGATLEDPISAVGTLTNKTSSQLQESLELEDITARFPLQLIPWVEAKDFASLAVGAALQSDVKKPAGKELAIKWRDVLRAAVGEGDLRDWNHLHVESVTRLRPPPGETEIILRTTINGEEEHSHSRVIDDTVDALKHDKSLNPYEKRLLGCIVDPNKLASTTFDDVHLPEKTVDGIRSMVSMPLLYPEAFSSGVLKNHSTSGALLFGPPGTGKTLLVRALARESGARMLGIQPSDVNDMYVGEGEKLVKAVFSLARRLSPCIVFLDEVDALFSARSSHSGGGNQSHRQILTEFMQEMDGLSSASANKDSKVMVIGASNRPFDLDEAVLRRLPRRMLIDLPDAAAREQILKIMLRNEKLADDVDLKKLAEETPSFSGSDLKHLCVSAAFAAIKERLIVPWKKPETPASVTASGKSASHASKDSGGSGGSGPSTDPMVIDVPSEPPASPSKKKVLPTTAKASNEDDNANVKRTVRHYADGTSATITERKLSSRKPPSTDEKPKSKRGISESEEAKHSTDRTITAAHFKIALSEIRASASEDGEISALRKWSERFGEGGTQRGKKSGFGNGFGFGDGVVKTGEYGKVRQD